MVVWRLMGADKHHSFLFKHHSFSFEPIFWIDLKTGTTRQSNMCMRSPLSSWSIVKIDSEIMTLTTSKHLIARYRCVHTRVHFYVTVVHFLSPVREYCPFSLLASWSLFDTLILLSSSPTCSPQLLSLTCDLAVFFTSSFYVFCSLTDFVTYPHGPCPFIQS